MTHLRRRLANAQAEDGMSLIEVMMAMLIFAVISTGVIYTMMSVLSVGRDSRARQVASNLASGEIDLARDIDDLFDLVPVDRAPVTLNGDVFRVKVSPQWVSDPGLDFSCGGSAGGSGGALRYKRVNVTVTWDNMRPGTEPVRMDTVIGPKERINDPALGTILVSVLNAAGTGNQGVTVTTTPSTGTAVAPTDSQGCTYVLKVPPGSYDVKVSKADNVDAGQSATPASAITVQAGASTSVGFQLDRAARYTARLATNYVPAAGESVRLPTDLKTTFWNTYDIYGRTPDTGSGTASQVFRLHPYTSGYQAYAGECDSGDPGQWPAEKVSGQQWEGVRDPAKAADPGSAVDIDVPMGIVRVKGGGSGSYLKAVSEAPFAGLPGCAATVTYTYGSVLSGAPTTIALPYGTWKLYRGSSTSSMTSLVGPGELELPPAGVPSRSEIDPGGVVRLDPRVVIP
ncbi:prepilin-type N-terminal cleavage/methylation domain-containing protein [Cellulomonas fimi]|uniref:Prepilin-type N-terminal cleavage/methylation domain-containing protein n=1 Tax=Cellulomonas fimi TaxID=1708 RepID=A0A7Y0QHD0_CELFI|nr:prepilin-type N-terminal cleavage/methylation domain-containing protein [Cellulomonas fimi]NMR20160.1 prepilin-type N-terminal cleavage/methylation domain-containing protein [Cellulomonas fimi]